MRRLYLFGSAAGFAVAIGTALFLWDDTQGYVTA